MKKAEIRELKEEEAIIIQAKEDIPPDHLQAIADALEKYIKETRGPIVLAIDSRFKLTICDSRQIEVEVQAPRTPEQTEEANH